jgi:hypothetical protein
MHAGQSNLTEDIQLQLTFGKYRRIQGWPGN